MTRTRSPIGGMFAASALVASAISLLAAQPAQAQFTATYANADPAFATNPSAYGYASLAHSISSNGTYVGTYVASDDTPDEPYPSELGYVTTNGVAASFAYKDAYQGTSTYLYGVNDSGVMTGYYDDYNGTEKSFIYNPNPIGGGDKFSTPTIAGSSLTLFTSVNNSGLVATAYQPSGSSGYQSAIYSIPTGTFTTFTNDASDTTQPYFGISNVSNVVAAISEDTVLNGNIITGSFVGAYRDASNVRHGYIYTNKSTTNSGTYTPIDVPGAVDTFADGVNDADIVTGFYQSSAGGPDYGFAYANGVYTTLDFVDSSGNQGLSTYLSEGNLNDSNQFVGQYSDSGGIIHSFTGTLSQTASAPEPSACALLVGPGGLIGSTVMIRRRRAA